MNRTQLIERVSILDKLVIPHTGFSEAVRGISECVLKSAAYSEPVGSLLLANGGMGKSTVCHAIMKHMKTTKKIVGKIEKTIVPAFYSEIPSPATVKSVAASMLRDMGAASPNNGSSAAHMTERLCMLLSDAETTLVFLDETQNLFKIGTRSTKVNLDVCNWVKWMINKTKISFCLVGLPDFAPYLSADSQLTRRFPMHFHLRPLMPGDQSFPGTLVPFLAEVLKQTASRLELKSVPAMNNLLATKQIYAATGGIPAFIMSLLKEAALQGLSSGKSCLELEDFADAWDAGITFEASITKDNPFRMSPAALEGSLRSASW
ncbi:TniB family NTP-binding protein [Janthinobacterium sp. PSPC1-1]|uniref:TniB family NTP-binding protein n=1 Tax=Janthinobacterium sp. PSPC1-1 TaxID=2804581 RepID=UPI003CF567AA